MTGSHADTRADLLLKAVRSPRGRYGASRAAQLSGVPQRTIYDWRLNQVLVPDFDREYRAEWSYRDLLLLRMVAWLRSHGMERTEAAKHAAEAKRLMALRDPSVIRTRSDGRELFRGDRTVSEAGQQALPSVLEYVAEFRLDEAAVALAELGKGDRWGPDLLTPTPRSRISPWVMGGEPCVRDTRIPTSTVFALSTIRRLDSEQIIALYPGLEVADVHDAIDLEARLRGVEAREAA